MGSASHIIVKLDVREVSRYAIGNLLPQSRVRELGVEPLGQKDRVGERSNGARRRRHKADLLVWRQAKPELDAQLLE